MRNFLDHTNLPRLNGSVVLVTGGTGSFGQKFAEVVLNQYNVRKLVIFSRDEAKQFDMRNDPRFETHHKRMRFFIGDVRDVERLEMAFRDVDYVVHAAALKHIPTAEYNPFECIRTNVHGAENVVTASIRSEVKQVIALSTDKAANPINLYGASKLASDKIFIAAKNLVGSVGRPKFAVVRYGNVIGSRGSIVPFFRQKILEGSKSLPITDPRMTRFWITLEQGVGFVLSCLSAMQGGEIFVPKSPSMKVVDLAATLAPDLQIHIIGIRPGEKLHEVMITEDEARATIELPNQFVIRPEFDGANRIYDTDQRAVSEHFRYASDSNSEWLSIQDMRHMIQEIHST